jgi:hypothetical protein
MVPVGNIVWCSAAVLGDRVVMLDLIARSFAGC